jgi:hypothetical protein
MRVFLHVLNCDITGQLVERMEAALGMGTFEATTQLLLLLPPGYSRDVAADQSPAALGSAALTANAAHEVRSEDKRRHHTAN